MSDTWRKLYFVIRADERGPALGPYLDRAEADRWAAAEEDDVWILATLAQAEFIPREVNR